MSIHDLVALSGVPGLGPGLQILTQTYKTLENIKLYQRQCTDMSNRCVSLLLALRDSSTGLEGGKAIELADEIAVIIGRIYAKVSEWAALNKLRSFLAQSEIKDGIERFHRDIDAAMMKFNVSINLELTRGHRDLVAVQERDKAELRDLLQSIVKSTDDVKMLMGMRSPEAVEDIIQSLETELHDPSLEPTQEETFRQGLLMLHESTSLIPPLTDLTQQVSRNSDCSMGSSDALSRGITPQSKGHISRQDVLTKIYIPSQAEAITPRLQIEPSSLDPRSSLFSHRRLSTASSESSVSSSNSGRRLRIPFMKSISQDPNRITEESQDHLSGTTQISPISIKATHGSLQSHTSVGTLNQPKADGGALRLFVSDQARQSRSRPSSTSSRGAFRQGSSGLSMLEVPRAPSSLPANFGAHFHPRTPSSDGNPSPVLSAISSDSISMIGSIRHAVTDPTPIIHTTKDGSVTAGTLEGLVERLVNNSNLTQDVEYRDVLLTTCTDFTSPDEVFAILVRRFHDADTNTDSHAEHRVAIRYNIMVVVKYWLSSHHIGVSPQVLWQIKEFALSTLSVKRFSSLMKDKAKDLLQSIDHRSIRDSQSSSPLMLSPGRRIPKTSEILPHDLAIALTLLEGDNYNRVLPADYIAYLRSYPNPNNLDSACVTNNKIDHWVKKSILHYDHIESRGEVLKFFVNTAQKCRENRNFMSMAAIVSALESAPIERLSHTKAELPPDLKQTLDNLIDILDPTHNHQTYKAALREFLDPEQRASCIPWLAVHIDEMDSVFLRYSPAIEVEGRSLINFERYTEFTARIREVLQFKPPDLERYRQQGQLAYLEHQLRGVEIHPNSDDELLARSLALEAEETRIHKKRVRELNRLGFRTSRKTTARTAPTPRWG